MLKYDDEIFIHSRFHYASSTFSCFPFQFVEANFDDEGLELELWTPEDWSPEPVFLQELRNPQLRGLAKRINRLWKDLSRRIKDEVKENPQLYSIIYVPNGFIVPGGENFLLISLYFYNEMTENAARVFRIRT